MNKKINIPESWSEVTLEQFQEISSLSTSGLVKTIDIISILTNEDPDVIKKYDNETLTAVINKLSWTEQPPLESNYKPVITINGKQYGLVPKLHEVSFGLWMDIEEYLKDPIENAHYIFACLYRPLITAFNDDDRIIEDYDSKTLESRAKLFKESLKIDEVYGALLFFCLIANNCIRIIQDSLV